MNNYSLDASMDAICDAVTAKVLKRIRQNFAELEPEIIEKLVQSSAVKAAEIAKASIASNNSSECRQLQRELAELKERVNQLQPAAYKAAEKAKASLQRELAELKERVAQLEKNINSYAAQQTQKAAAANSGYNVSAKAQGSVSQNTSVLTDEQMENIFSYPDNYLQYKGWVYYISSHGELFKVRPNGGDNQKIFNGKVRSFEFWASSGCDPLSSIRGNMLRFEDSTGTLRAVRI